MSFALIHEITYWVSVSDLSSSSWWNKRIPWNSTRSVWLCLCRGKHRLLGKPCDLGPLPSHTAAPLGAWCGFLPLCTLVSFQKKSKHTRRWCALVCVPGWGWAADQYGGLHTKQVCTALQRDALGLHCHYAVLLLTSGVFGCNAYHWVSLLRESIICFRNKACNLFSIA